MAEPSTGALAVTGVVGSVTLGTAFPEIDLAALVGAFGGAFLFVIAADSMPAWRRVGYLFAGWIGGYFGAAELLGLTWTKTAGFSGFVCGAICVAVATGFLEWMRTGDMPRWLQWCFRRFTGKGET